MNYLFDELKLFFVVISSKFQGDGGVQNYNFERITLILTTDLELSHAFS